MLLKRGFVMIHSLAGGVVRDIERADFAKVVVQSPCGSLKLWYKTQISLSAGDIVIVPLKNERVEGIVERVDKNVSAQCSPVPFKQARYVISRK